jgi:hypothetical protein
MRPQSAFRVVQSRVEHLAIGTSGSPKMDDIQPNYATVPLPTFQPADKVVERAMVVQMRRYTIAAPQP